MSTDLAKELRAIVEQVTDPIAALEELKPRLRGLIRGMDNFMQAAQDVTSAAEQSNYSKVATLNATKRWESKIGQVYADFKFVNETLQEIVGKGLRRHGGKGKSLKQRKEKGGKDYSGMAPEALKKQVAGIVQDLAQGIHQVADDGAFLLQQIDRITRYKNPSESTLTEELAALWQDFIDFRESFGAKVWAPLTGLLKRLDAISAPLTKFGPEVGREMDKPPQKGLAAAWGAWAEMEAVECLSDQQKRVLVEAMERDQRRAVGKYGLMEQKEGPGFKGEPSAGGADKMAAKGYKFKILLKDGPPLYAKTEKGAKEVQQDYPGSKIVANEAIDGEITDARLLAEADSRSLASVLPDFDALLEGDDDDRPFDLIGEAVGKRKRKLVKAHVRELHHQAKEIERKAERSLAKARTGKDRLKETLRAKLLGSHAKELRQRAAKVKRNPEGAIIQKKKPRGPIGMIKRSGSSEKHLGPHEKMVFGTIRKVEDGSRAPSNLAEEGIGQTIIKQMGGINRIQAMLGATVLWLPKGVAIKWPSKEPSKGNYVEIILTPDDLYDMSFFNTRGVQKKPVKSYDGIYADALVDTFENQTGWLLRM